MLLQMYGPVHIHFHASLLKAYLHAKLGLLIGILPLLKPTALETRV